ncbi:hypothetical protein I302_106566 [Kwoniella bestiolae CBS 10118]|uniref:Uncharacterized protein n=1 Tax=Kwoniella bestiolae CBS 10118 TaxID=1296100 RepID=A0A1B9G117_9TREE|nr:hypothetical protein I302_06172 [Kwoniella bestiolae CBS 10118]OCF24711.1 hypothetical protein I302_06172 [Kwoniella bestiolae CBS 10118]
MSSPSTVAPKTHDLPSRRIDLRKQSNIVHEDVEEIFRVGPGEGVSGESRDPPGRRLNTSALKAACREADSSPYFRRVAGDLMMESEISETKQRMSALTWGSLTQAWKALTEEEQNQPQNVEHYDKQLRTQGLKFANIHIGMRDMSAMTTTGRPDGAVTLTDAGRKAHLFESMRRVRHSTYDTVPKGFNVPQLSLARCIPEDMRPDLQRFSTDMSNKQHFLIFSGRTGFDEDTRAAELYHKWAQQTSQDPVREETTTFEVDDPASSDEDLCSGLKKCFKC